MPKLIINGIEVEVAPGTSVMQACTQLGIEIPHFCYHDRLSVAANCRMCMVEIEKMPKPVPSCAQPCADGMVVHTDSPAVQTARKSVMEMLLINHPLDCPICDQGGACDLQDQAMAYGGDRSRYTEDKRAVTDKDFGPLIRTVMTRCIHCTRCIRFMDEVAGTPELGKINRGGKAEITNLDGQPLTSELSGNLIDVCPVGALTNKPSAFQLRPWEVRPVESVDVLDAVGSAIRVDVRGNEVMRILPRLNEAVNMEWIHDKTRFACDGLKRQRLDQPYLRENGALRPARWDEVYAALAARLKNRAGEQIAALAGDLADCESLFALKAIMKALGAPHLDCRLDGALYDVSSRAGYVMNSGIAGIDKADALLLVGVNPRHEAALVNARIRRRWSRGGFRVGMVGVPADLGYPYRHVGAGPAALAELMTGQAAFAQILAEAKNPMIIVGAGALARADGAALQAATRDLALKFNMIRPDWNGYNVLQTEAARVGALDIGFLPQAYGLSTTGIYHAAQTGQVDTVFLLGADAFPEGAFGDAFVIYLGHHGDRGANRADVILPGAAYTEKDATYVNTEGRVQRTRRAVFAPGSAREDSQILIELAQALGLSLPFKDQATLATQMAQVLTQWAPVGQTPLATPVGAFGKAGALSSEPFKPTISNFYGTDVISRASPTMAKCIAEILPLIMPTVEA